MSTGEHRAVSVRWVRLDDSASAAETFHRSSSCTDPIRVPPSTITYLSLGKRCIADAEVAARLAVNPAGAVLVL
jgi:hypothetical protein